MAAEPNAQTRPAMMRQYADVLERTASEPWPADSAVDMVARHGQRTIALCLRSGADAKEALARLQTAHATQSAELQAMREERDRCCDDYQREAQRAVEAEHRITALQAQLAEARGRAIEECIAVVKPSAELVAAANAEVDKDGVVSVTVEALTAACVHLHALLTKPAGEGE